MKNYFIILITCFSIIFCSNLDSQTKYELLYLQKDYEQLIEQTQNLSDSNDYFWHASALEGSGQTLKSIEILKQGLDKYHGSPQLEKLIAEYFFTTGQYTLAKPLLKKYSDQSPYFIYYINVLEFESNYKQAIGHLLERTKTDSLNFFYLKHLAENYDNANNPVKAVETYDRLISINPNDLISYLKKARIEIQMQEFKGAMATCDTALKVDPLNKKLIKLKGVAGFNMKDYKTSQDCFISLLSQGDSSKFVMKHLGISEFQNQAFTYALEHLLNAYELDSNDFDVCYMLGRCYLNTMHPETGLFYFNRVDTIIHPKPELLSSLYVDRQSIYSSIGKYDSALYCYQIAYSYQAKPEYLFFMGSLCQHKLKDKKQALAYYEKFIQALPPQPESDHEFKDNILVLSLRKAAETNITGLKEELFFEGDN